jgi:hypothetical protein
MLGSASIIFVGRGFSHDIKVTRATPSNALLFSQQVVGVRAQARMDFIS